VNRAARRALHAPLLATLVLATACGGGAASEPPGPTPSNATVALSRDSAVLITGDTLRLTATVRDAKGQVVADAPVQWSSSAPSVATVAGGLVTVLTQGTTEISATAGGTPAKATVVAFAGSGARQPGMESYDRLIPRLMAQWEIPGGAVAVVKDGKLLFARGYGYADVETHQPVEADALFRIASVSKPITSVAILKLVDEGKLSLDDHPFAILSDLAAPPGSAEDPRLAGITIRHLLEHSGGWDRDASGDPMFMSSTIAEALGTEAPAKTTDIIRYMRGKPLDFDPGTRYVYSNFGYAVLGRVIEKVTGQPYDEYVKSAVLEPMGISRMAIGA
jgi:CubicO group peptidase (beta-lactamase class C family)